MVSTFNFTEYSHRRYNPLSDSWVLVSPHRAQRPWLGQQETLSKPTSATYDQSCFLCPGNSRSNGTVNPKYTSTYVFPNDFSAIKLDQPDLHSQDSCKNSLKARLHRAESVKGNCFVICFSPNHNLTLPRMNNNDLFNVVETWATLYTDLQGQAKNDNMPFKYLQIFENKGTAMGCSNLHPHGQAWCLNYIPSEPAKELESCYKYKEKNGVNLFRDYIDLELCEKERVVLENDSFVVLVPYWAVWPFETIVISKVHLPSLVQFNNEQKSDLASIIKKLTIKYDNLFETSFPYSMGIHQAPLNATNEELDLSWFHIHFYPPLLRSATVKKFLVGFELLAEPQRDLTAEQAAHVLRNLNDQAHYLENRS